MLLLSALLPAALQAQTLKIDLARMSDMLSTRYYIAEKGELPAGYVLLGGKTNTADSVGTFLFPNPLESAFDLRQEYVEYDEGTGLIFHFRVPGDYYFNRKEERRDLFYYSAPRNVSIPGLGISIERVDDRVGEIETASLKSAWVEDVRYNLAKERVEKMGKGLLSLDIPISLPKPIERIIGRGEETNLTVQGSEKIAISGKSDWCSNCPKTEGTVQQSKFPDLNMEQELNVSLHGTIGEKINVEIQHSSVGGGAESTNRIRINYRGFDDDVIKLIEMGDTDLSLAGAQLVSYSGTAKGLFGVKALATTGPLDLTVIASKEEGETASGTFSTSGGQFSSVPVNDYDFIQRQFFFFENPGKDLRNPNPGFRDVYPIVGGTGGGAVGGDEVEVFVTLVQAEYGDPAIFKYWAKGYIDTLNNGLSPDSLKHVKPVLALLVKQLFMEQGDFTLIEDYGGQGNEHRYIGIELASPLDETRSLMVRYKGRHMAEGYLRGVEFAVGDYKRFPSSESDSLVARLICLPKDASTGKRATDPIWNQMMRNVYSLGSSQIDSKSLRVRIEDTSNRDNKNIDPASNLSYLRIFGLDTRINSSGLSGKDDLLDNVPGIVDYERGYLMFPWFEPFNPPPEIVKAYLSDTTDAREKNFDYASLDRDAGLYEEALSDALKGTNHHYNIVVEASNGQRTFQLSALDIIEGSEVVTVDGTKLARGTDYDIDYASGTVTLKTSILPDSKVNIDYQHKPLVGGGKNTLLGLGANLNLSPDSRINGTFLYSSVGAPKYAPRLGEEPGRMMAADLNGSLIFYPKWMTTIVNLLPRVDTNSQSSLNLGGEVAVSIPNPNTKGEAIVDDMEGIEEASQVSLLRRGWYESSPALEWTSSGDVLRSPDTEPEFYWYNAARTPRQEYFIASRRDLNPKLNERENSTLTTLFLDAINPTPGQWCGIMTGFPGGGLDLSTAQYIEIWVNDFAFDPTGTTPRHGTVHLDFGRIDEDFYQNDLKKFDDEDQPPYGWTIYEDTGFNGETCIYPNNFSDAAWSENKFVYQGVDCRKGNGMHDTEDLNSNGYLDDINGYYTVSFNLADSASIDVRRDFSPDLLRQYDKEKNLNPRKAWRKYRIDLSKMRKVGLGEPRLDAIQHMRIWMEGLDSVQVFNDPGIQFGDARLVEFGELQFVGSRWELNGIRNLADSLDSSGKAPGQQLIVGTINNKDDASQYRPPYSVQQEEGIDNKEGSLRMNFDEFADSTSFRIVKRYFGQGQNYQQYRDLQFFVRPNYVVDDNDNIDFYFQIAYDSTNYYEVEVPFTSETSRQWIEVNVSLSDLTNLKFEADPQHPRKIVTKQIRDAVTGRIYSAKLRGNPTLFNVRFLYSGLRNRSNRTLGTGEVWFDDIRLGSVRRDIDHAENVRFSADFSGILQVNGSYTRTGPEFRSLRQSRGSGSTNSGLNLNAKTEVNYFVPTGGFELPVSLQYNSTDMLPKYMLNSDVEIADAGVRRDLRSVTRSYGFNVSMSRRGSSNYIMKNFFDNLKTSFSYSERDNSSSTHRDTTWTMSGSLSYQLQFRQKRELGLFRGVKWRYWLSSLSYETGASRQTREEYALSGDTTFIRRPFYYSASWQNSVNSLYEPFESVKINFNLAEQRDLAVDHNVRGIPIGAETNFGHNLSLNYQPSHQVFILSEFNPRFDYKSRYSEDLNPNRRQVRRVVDGVPLSDPFGTRSISNEREMTFAFILDTGKYIVRLGEILNLVDKGEGSKRSAGAYGTSWSMPKTAADRARQFHEQQQGPKHDNAGKIERDEEEPAAPPPPAEGSVPVAPATGQPAKGPEAGGLKGLGAAQRPRPGEALVARRDTVAAARADTTGAKVDTLLAKRRSALWPVRKLVRFLGSVEPINANINIDHRSSYDRIYDRADLWYQLGFTERSGAPSANDSIADNSPLRATDAISVDLRSAVGLTANIGVEVKARFNLGEDDFNGKRSKNTSSVWPTLTLNWKGMERYRLLNRYMQQSNLVVGFERRYSKTLVGEEHTLSLSPTWNLEWKNTLSSDVSGTYSKRTHVANNQELWDMTWGVNLGLRYNIQGSKGFGIPLPLLKKRKLSFNSVLTTSLNLAYSQASTQIDPASVALSVSPNVSYRFSSNVTGGLGIDYRRTSGGRLGQVHQTIDVRLNAEFKF